MKKLVFCFIGTMLVLGCQDKKQPEQTTTQNSEKPSSFTMYEMSEMASLMEQMYVDNQRIKQKIENNELDFGEFPEYYLTIHSAVFTDPDDLDEFFTTEADRFLKAQQLVYTDTINVKTNFNTMVSACIECHTVKCTGPIERIKKLYIK